MTLIKKSMFFRFLPRNHMTLIKKNMFFRFLYGIPNFEILSFCKFLLDLWSKIISKKIRKNTEHHIRIPNVCINSFKQKHEPFNNCMDILYPTVFFIKITIFNRSKKMETAPKPNRLEL
jgi:hypothetical protein